MITELLLILFLVALNAFFVAAEFALVKIRSTQLETDAENGNKYAKLSLEVISNLTSFLSACQLFITVLSLLIGAVGEPLIEGWLLTLLDMIHLNVPHPILETISYAISLTILTLMHVILGEAVPKVLAITKTKQTMLFVVYPLYWLHAGFRPAIWLLNKLSNLTLNLFGLHGDSHNETHSAEELRIMIDQGEDSGTIAKNENEIIQNVFDFNNIRAHQIMTPRQNIYSINVADDANDILDEIINQGYSRVPVYGDHEDVILGVLYAKDLLRMQNKKDNDSDLVITQAIRPAHFVHEDKKISDLLKELQAKKLHMAIVINEYGSISGLLTIEDIIEELVGEIEDEHDNEQPIVKQNGDEYIVSALARVADVNDFLELKIPSQEGKYETVNGYVTQLLDKIPDLNDSVKTEDYLITIIKKVNQTVLTIKMKRLR